ncbi:hypothetical protein VARIO8X_50160 [Burkholderiales bacterium 8X]|nr:hypothetical protein VARIO8X_50160 [Burkholderiales bacterium 8X]
MASRFDAVHAIEPNPKTYDVLRINARLAGNIHCHRVAASHAKTMLRFEQQLGNVGGSHIVAAAGGTSNAAASTIEVAGGRPLKEVRPAFYEMLIARKPDPVV